MKHANTGKCPKCQDILNKYAGFYEPLREWFEAFQLDHPEAHTSCAGRGFFAQEEVFARRASLARYGQSAHNFNAALDIFEASGDLKNIYEPAFYIHVLKPNLPTWIEWYGEPRAPYYELPHVQIKEWKKLRDAGLLCLVEPVPIVVK